jgi:hypothetical protein
LNGKRPKCPSPTISIKRRAIYREDPVKYKNHKVVLDFYKKDLNKEKEKAIQFFSASALARSRGTVAGDFSLFFVCFNL